MDIQTKDGIVLRGVPDDATDEIIKARINRIRATRDFQARPWGSGLPELAQKGGFALQEKLTDIGVPYPTAEKIGAATDVAIQAVPTLLSSFSLEKAKPLLEGPAKWLMQKAVKPATTGLESGAGGKALATMLEEGILPTHGGMQKTADLARKINTGVEESIANSPAAVSLQKVGGRLAEPYEKAVTQVNPRADMSAVRGTWDEFVNSPLIGQQRALQAEFGPSVTGDVSIPVKLAHELKKGTYASLGSKAYGEVGTSSTEAQKQLARGLREEVGAAVPEILEPLKREAALLNVRDVVTRRALQQGNNNPLGFAALRMDDALSALSSLSDRSPLVKALMAQMLYHGSKPGLVAPAVIGGTLANNQDTQ